MGWIQMEEQHFAAFMNALLHSKVVTEIEGALPTVVKDTTLAAGILSEIPIPGAQAAGKIIGEIGAGAQAIEAKAAQVQGMVNTAAGTSATPATTPSVPFNAPAVP